MYGIEASFEEVKYVMRKSYMGGVRLVHGYYRPGLDNHCGDAWVEFPEGVSTVKNR